MNHKKLNNNKYIIFIILTYCFTFTYAKKNTIRPAPRFAHAMAYDSSRDRIVVFGGAVSAVGQEEFLNDTWEYDWKQWRKIEISGPAPRAYAGMAYDAGRQVIVLTGGRNTKNGTYADTWEYNGSFWTCKIEKGFFGRDHISLIYNPIRQVILAFGGWDGTTTHGDLWQWDGHQWVMISQTGPPKRAAYALLWDHNRKTALLYGGTNQQARYSDIWEWDGRKWSCLTDPYNNPNRNHFTMVYDKALHAVISFGGLNRRYQPDDTTMILLGNRFRNVKVKGPTPRFNHTMIYIDSRKFSFLFGGCDRKDDKYLPMNDSWIWAGKEWRPTK